MKQNKTLLYAFERVAETLNTTELNENLFNTEEIKYLTERMELTDVQVYVLSALFNNIYKGLTLEQMQQKLGWTPFDMLKNEPDINELVYLKYILSQRNEQQEIRYYVTPETREALRNNKPLESFNQMEERLKKTPLEVRFREAGKYLREWDDRHSSYDSMPEYRHMPRIFRQQVESIEAELNWQTEEIMVFAKVLVYNDNISRGSLFQSHADRLRFRPGAEALLKRRLIYSIAGYKDDYCIMPTVLRQLEEGEEMRFSLKFADNEELFEGLRLQFKLRNPPGHSEKARSYTEMEYDLLQILYYNQHLTFCISFCNVLAATALVEMDMLTLFYMCHRLVNLLKEEVTCRELEEIFITNYLPALHYLQDLRNGETKLQKLGLVEHVGHDFSDGETLRLTREARKTLLGDFKAVKSRLLNDRDLKKPEKFAEKRMFYNERERGEVERLTKLLMPQNFNDVKRRLRECGERTCFVCLFYGAPGTGKTETVQQIARQTGRALYIVDISEINSKWVGESEKNIKGIFDRYGWFAEHSPVEPILFFNEADGVFSRRFDTAASGNPTVTQMLNAIQNIVLQEMETLDGILIATTNLTQNLDPAMERRILYKVKFDKPATAVKAQLWQSSIPTLTADEARTLAQRYDFSGGQIENVKRKSVVDNILYGLNADYNRIDDYCSREMLAASRPRIGFGA
jgi:hypothetical protein